MSVFFLEFNLRPLQILLKLQYAHTELIINTCRIIIAGSLLPVHLAGREKSCISLKAGKSLTLLCSFPSQIISSFATPLFFFSFHFLNLFLFVLYVYVCVSVSSLPHGICKQKQRRPAYTEPEKNPTDWLICEHSLKVARLGHASKQKFSSNMY